MFEVPRRALLVVALGFAGLGCKGGADVDAHYSVRGQVVSSSGTHAVIHHERIDAFKDRDGKASPMESMAMNFLLGPGVDAAAFKPGAKLSIEFDLRWSNGDPLLITRATPLPEATQLALTAH